MLLSTGSLTHRFLRVPKKEGSKLALKEGFTNIIGSFNSSELLNVSCNGLAHYAIYICKILICLKSFLMTIRGFETIQNTHGWI